MQNLSSKQSLESSQDEKQDSLCHSTLILDVDQFNLKTNGCGMCDEMFEIEEELVQHCYELQ